MNENEVILKESLSQACQATYMPIIDSGREKIFALPRQWVIDNIHSMAQDILNLSDEWEYIRLLEVYRELDDDLLRKLVAIGLKSNNGDVKEAAEHFNPD